MARKLVGIVASDVQDKTIVVAVARRVTHPLYGKQYTITKKFAAHDETNQARKNDKVEIEESAPRSKRKSWALTRVIEVAPTLEPLKEDV